MQLPAEARDYQGEMVRAVRLELRAQRTALVQLPTGAGKTGGAASLIYSLRADYAALRTLVIVPKVSIIRSFCRDLERFAGLRATIYCADLGLKDMTGAVVVGSWQSLQTVVLPPFDLIICDEAHRIDQSKDESGYYGIIRRAMQDFEQVRVVGLTATPFRSNGYIYGLNKLFTHLSFHRDLRWTTERGFTVPAVLAAPTDPALGFRTDDVPIIGGDFALGELSFQALDIDKCRRQLKDALSRMSGRRKVVWACVSIEHARTVDRLLRGECGERSTCIVSDSEGAERDEVLGEFTEDAACRHLVFVSIVAEGFDYAPIDCVVLLRPTRSACLALQIIGRGLRPSADKRDCLVLDYGEVVKNCGPLDAPFVREGRRKSLLEEHDALDCQVVTCLSCGAFAFPAKGAKSWQCTQCGALGTPKERDVVKSLREEAETEAPLYDARKAVVKRWTKAEEWTDVVEHVEVTPWGFSKAQRASMTKVEVFCRTRPGAVFVLRDPEQAPPDWNEWKCNWMRELRAKVLAMVELVRLGQTVELTCAVKEKDGKERTDYVSHRVVGRAKVPKAPSAQEALFGYDV